MIETAGFLASWKAVDYEDEETNEVETEDKGYLLTFPQTFATAETESEEEGKENVGLS